MSLADEIMKLEDLRRDGVLSNEEFAKAKARLLDQDSPGGREQSTMDRADKKLWELHGRVRKALEWVDDETWGTILHLALIIPGLGWLVSIGIWWVMKERSPDLEAHGVNIVNWLLSYVIYMCAFALLSILYIGKPFMITVTILAIVFPLIGAFKAQKGEIWRYPLSFRFLKPPYAS